MQLESTGRKNLAFFKQCLNLRELGMADNLFIVDNLVNVKYCSFVFQPQPGLHDTL